MNRSDQVKPASREPHVADVQINHTCGSAQTGILPAEIEGDPHMQQVSENRTRTSESGGAAHEHSSSHNVHSILTRLDQSTTMLPSQYESGAPSQLVYALGKLSFDYGTRARRLYFSEEMRKMEGENGPIPNIDNPALLHKYLTASTAATSEKDGVAYNILNGPQRQNRAKVSAIQWLLQLDETPIYAIVPMGPFAYEVHDTLVGFLKDQLDEVDSKTGRVTSQGAERISVPGVIIGEVQLFTGETVPAIQPDIRAMYSWTTSALANAASDVANAAEIAKDDLEDFLTRVYDETRNLGISSEERAINYAATDALVLQSIFADVRSNSKNKGLELDSFSVKRSPICRADFDCWDVSVIFYDPENLNRGRVGYRFTIDVSDVVPVLIGKRARYTLR